MLEFLFKEKAQFVEKVTFEPLMDFKKKNILEVGNIKKAVTFKSFLHLRYKNTITFFCDTAF